MSQLNIETSVPLSHIYLEKKAFCSISYDRDEALLEMFLMCLIDILAKKAINIFFLN